MINNFKQIIQTASNDVTAMNSKRSIEEACLAEEDVEECLRGVEELLKDPFGYGGKKRQAAPAYSETEQQAVCSSFQSVSHSQGNCCLKSY